MHAEREEGRKLATDVSVVFFSDNKHTCLFYPVT